MKELKNQKGMALVITLLVVVILTVTVTEFIFATWVDYSMAADFRDDQRAIMAVRGGVEAAKEILVQDFKQSDKIDSLVENWAVPSIPVPFYNTFVFVTIKDESGKLDLNELFPANSSEPNSKLVAVFERLLEKLELDKDIASAVIDWIDVNEEGLYEYGYYQSLTPPYKCKNGKLDSMEELKRIAGITPEVYYRLRPFVTIYSDWGSATININTAKKELIHALDEGISEQMVEQLILARIEQPFENTTIIKTLIPDFADQDLWVRFSPLIKVNSKTFSVTATTTVGEVMHDAEAVFTNRNANSATLKYFRIM